MSLNQEQTVQELIKLRNPKTGFLYFLRNYVWIGDPKEGTHFQFDPFPVQEALVPVFQGYKLLIILKARQLGISWLIAAFCLWLAMYFKNVRIILISKDEDAARELLGKSQYIYRYVQDEVKYPYHTNNTERLSFFEGRDSQGKRLEGNVIKTFASTPESGRGEAASLVVMDEFTAHKHAEANYGTLQATVSEGKAHLLICANGDEVGSFFDELFTGGRTMVDESTKLGMNGFRSIFLDTFSNPLHNQEWWEKGLAANPNKAVFKRENPRQIIEAFLAAGQQIFDAELIEARAEANYSQPIPKIPVSETIGSTKSYLRRVEGLTIYRTPQPGHRYVIGVDTSEGDAVSENTDFDCAYVLDANTKQICAIVHGKWNITLFAEYIFAVHLAYNNAFVIPERNNHGWSFIQALRTLDRIFDNPAIMYHYDGFSNRKKNLKPGWPTMPTTKEFLKNKVATALQEEIEICDNDLLDEMRSFVRLTASKMGARGKRHDDRVIAYGLALIGSDSITGTRDSVKRTRTHIPRKRRRRYS